MEQIQRLLAQTRDGRGSALVLRGEAGVGKTALLNEAVRAANGTRVLRALAVQSETDVPFAALHQLLAPVVDRIDTLPGVQAPQLGVGGAGRVLFFPSADSALRLIGLDGSGLRTVGAPGAGIGRSPLYLDATTAAFLSRSCQGRAQVTTVDLTDSAPQTAPDGCPVHVQGSTVTFDRKGRGTLQVICPNGCRGQMQLYISLHPKQISTHEENRYIDKVFDTRLANAKLAIAASPTAQRVRVKLVRPAIALLRHHHRRLRVFPGFSYSSDLGLGPELPEPVPMLTARLRR